MALIIPPGYGLLAMHWRHALATRDMVTTLGLDLSDAAGDFQAALIQGTSAFRQATAVTPSMDSNITLTISTLRVGSDPNPGPVFEQTWNEPGLRTMDGPPVSVATLIRKRTALGGRRGRGRFYWPGLLSDADVNEIGIITTGIVSSLQTDFDAAHAFLLSGTGGSPISLPPVVLHDALGIGVEPAPTPITAFVVQNLAATQRRRMRA